MIVLVMGVAGSGKTTVGQALAKQLGARFLEGDAFHTPANRSKMGRGIPLTDEDRGPWLEAIREAMVQAAGEGEPVVVACSALKHRYRRRLTAGVVPSPWFVHLTLDRAEATRRLRSRKDHFMPATLADSQFAALEPPPAGHASSRSRRRGAWIASYRSSPAASGRRAGMSRAPERLHSAPGFMLYDTCMNSMSSMSRLKLILAALAVVLVVIVVWQNRAAVETRILFITISMPRALLLLVTLMIGFAAGLVSAGAMRRRK